MKYLERPSGKVSPFLTQSDLVNFLRNFAKDRPAKLDENHCPKPNFLLGFVGVPAIAWSKKACIRKNSVF